MKSCKNKFILLLASLLTCATIFTFVGCTGNNDQVADDANNGQSTGDIIGDKDDEINELPDIAYALGIPQQFILNGITYDVDYVQHGDYELGEIIGYYVNREDYPELYEMNPNVMYAIDEENLIFNSFDHNRLTIYSLKGRDEKEFVALYVVDRVVNVYLNNSYMRGT